MPFHLGRAAYFDGAAVYFQDKVVLGAALAVREVMGAGRFEPAAKGLRKAYVATGCQFLHAAIFLPPPPVLSTFRVTLFITPLVDVFQGTRKIDSQLVYDRIYQILSGSMTAEDSRRASDRFVYGYVIEHTGEVVALDAIISEYGPEVAEAKSIIEALSQL